MAGWMDKISTGAEHQHPKKIQANLYFKKVVLAVWMKCSEKWNVFFLCGQFSIGEKCSWIAECNIDPGQTRQLKMETEPFWLFILNTVAHWKVHIHTVTKFFTFLDDANKDHMTTVLFVKLWSSLTPSHPVPWIFCYNEALAATFFYGFISHALSRWIEAGVSMFGLFLAV